MKVFDDFQKTGWRPLDFRLAGNQKLSSPTHQEPAYTISEKIKIERYLTLPDTMKPEGQKVDTTDTLQGEAGKSFFNEN